LSGNGCYGTNPGLRPRSVPTRRQKTAVPRELSSEHRVGILNINLRPYYSQARRRSSFREPPSARLRVSEPGSCARSPQARCHQESLGLRGGDRVGMLNERVSSRVMRGNRRSGCFARARAPSRQNSTSAGRSSPRDDRQVARDRDSSRRPYARDLARRTGGSTPVQTHESARGSSARPDPRGFFTGRPGGRKSGRVLAKARAAGRDSIRERVVRLHQGEG